MLTAGGIDENVRRTEELPRRSCAIVDLVAIGEVAGERRSFATRSDDLIARAVELVRTPRDEHDFRAGCGERSGNREADTGVAAGDQRDSIGKREQREHAGRQLIASDGSATAARTDSLGRARHPAHVGLSMCCGSCLYRRTPVEALVREILVESVVGGARVRLHAFESRNSRRDLRDRFRCGAVPSAATSASS
jgi:hypothetical protein